MTKKHVNMWQLLLIGLLFALGGAVPWQTANAERLLTENFEYSPGNLYQQGGWIRFGTNAAAPIQVLSGGLTYDGYLTQPVGGKVELGQTASGQDLMCGFKDDVMLKEGKVYVSFLLNVKDLGSKASKAYFFCLVPQSKAGLGDGKSGGEFVKLYALPSATDGKFNLAFAAAGNCEKAVSKSGDLDLNTTYLVVLSLEFVEGSNNDNISMWVNPVISAAEPAPTAKRDIYADTGGDLTLTSGGLKYVQLRQGQTATNDAPLVEIDGLRVGTAWTDLFDLQDVPDVPVITSSKTEHILSDAFVGLPVTFTSTIKGENLKDDITITLPADITADRTSITKEEAAEGVEVTFTVTPQEETYDYNKVITLTSTDAQPVEISVTGYVLSITSVESAAKIKEVGRTADYYDRFLYTGTAIVTGVEATDAGYYPGYNIYMQDETGGIMLNISYYGLTASPLAVGDEVTGVQFSIEESSNKTPTINLSSSTGFKKTGEGKTVEPKVVSISDVTAATADSYAYTLLKVEGVTFENAAGKQFSTSNTYFTDGTSTAPARVFAGSELIGQPLPEGKVNLTGVSRSLAQLTLYLRDAADIEEVKDNSTITVSEPSYDFAVALVGSPFTFTSVIKGENLKGDISLTLPSDITADVTTISKDVAESAEGATVTFTVNPQQATANYDHVITLKSDGAADVEIHVVGIVNDVVLIPTSVAWKSQLDVPGYEDKYFRYTGKAVVTAINVEDNGLGNEVVVYAQDMFGGMKISTVFVGIESVDALGLAVGDEITNIPFLMVDQNPAAPVMYALIMNEGTPLWEKTATGKTKTPIELSSMADVTASTAADYLYKLVTVKDVSFVDAEGKQYTTSNMSFTDGENTAVAQAMSTSDLLGQPLPAGVVTLTGVSSSGAQLSLRLRSSADVVAGAPEMTVIYESLMDFNTTAAPVGESSHVAKFTVVAANLPAPAPIEFGGDNPGLFVANPAVIPAGSGTHEVIVDYVPSAIGRHKANFIINTDAISPELNYSRMISAKAYDPEHLPEIVVTPATVDLKTTPGKPVTATVVLNAANCFDYITGARLGQGDNGGITINNTYLLPDSKDVQLTITFNPADKGEFTETFQYTTTMCETPATITVNAICEGEREPEDKQGDPFELNEDNPLVTHTQNFDTGVSNQPLKLDAWTNVAMTGTRAWWSYTSTDAEDPFVAAKVTAYDGTLLPADAEPCQMMLISPALNFKDAEDTRLQFKIMGMFLTEGQVSKLDVMLGIPNGTSQPDFYVMDGFGIPAIPDEAGKWIPYEVDMSNVEDMPDTFFIAFRFTSERSKAETATYYIDDFVWNPTGASVQGVGVDGHELYDVYNMQGIRVLSGADAAAVKRLPAGIYIINGKKVILK